jgi:hypothetical protein
LKYIIKEAITTPTLWMISPIICIIAALIFTFSKF